MKLRYLSIIPLLLTSCGSESVINNVAWYFDSDNNCYVVLDGPRNQWDEVEKYEKTWNIEIEKVHFVYTTYKYITIEDKQVKNQFYTSSKRLYIYNIL